MKWLFILTCLAAGLQEGHPVKFSANFDSGSIGIVNLIDSVWVRPSRTDSVLHLSYEIISRPDPANPANPDLQPSARWFYFMMEGVRGKHIYLDFQNTDPMRAVFSYDGNISSGLNITRLPCERYPRSFPGIRSMLLILFLTGGNCCRNA